MAVGQTWEGGEHGMAVGQGQVGTVGGERGLKQPGIRQQMFQQQLLLLLLVLLLLLLLLLLNSLTRKVQTL